MIVIGGVASSTVRAPISYIYTNGSMSIEIQALLDKIMPNLVPMLVTIAAWLLVAKKKMSATKVMGVIVAFAAVMVALGIM